MVAYMQLGVALFIHANIQPYVAANFFNDATTTNKVTSIDEIYKIGLSNFFWTYLVYALCLVGMLLGLSLGKRFLVPESLFGVQ